MACSNIGDTNELLSPSDLTFLYDGCKHCFVMKVKHGIIQPSIPIPTVFSRIASLQKEYYSNRRTEDFCPSLPPGIVRYGEKWIESNILRISETTSTCYIRGRFDIVVELDDHSFVVMDFKMGNPSDEKTEMYARQLQACDCFGKAGFKIASTQPSVQARIALLYAR